MLQSGSKRHIPIKLNMQMLRKITMLPLDMYLNKVKSIFSHNLIHKCLQRLYQFSPKLAIKMFFVHINGESKCDPYITETVEDCHILTRTPKFYVENIKKNI